MSKELEALKYLKENKRRHWLDNDKSNECLDIIENQLKALEIIKKKGVNIYFLKEIDYVDEYNELIKSHLGMKKLTRQEYDFLKEVLL